MEKIEEKVNSTMDDIDTLAGILTFTVVNPPTDPNKYTISNDEQQIYISIWSDKEAKIIKKKILELIDRL